MVDKTVWHVNNHRYKQLLPLFEISFLKRYTSSVFRKKSLLFWFGRSKPEEQRLLTKYWTGLSKLDHSIGASDQHSEKTCANEWDQYFWLNLNEPFCFQTEFLNAELYIILIKKNNQRFCFATCIFYTHKLSELCDYRVDN